MHVSARTGNNSMCPPGTSTQAKRARRISTVRSVHRDEALDPGGRHQSARRYARTGLTVTFARGNTFSNHLNEC